MPDFLRPPRLAEKIIARLIDPFVRDQAMGDFEEDFGELASRTKPAWARLWYVLQIFPVLKSYVYNSAYWGGVMFRHYLKTALRNLRQQKGYSFLNISGLALGLACSILIVFYIHHELSYDRFHANADRIFRVAMEGAIGSETFNMAITPYPLAPALARRYPEVVGAARIQRRDPVPVKYADKEFVESGIVYADPGLFDVFSFPFVRGDAKTALERPLTVVLTEGVARKYFGAEDPVGKFLKFDNQSDFAVAGVIKDVPSNSHLAFDLICSLETYFANNLGAREKWVDDINGYTYIRLDRPEAWKPLEGKLPGLIDEKVGGILRAVKGNIQLHLQPLTDIHLRSKLEWEFGGNSDILYIYIFAAIAVVILAIACVNFMNLATARSARRAREVAMRKVVGACRRDLGGQFLGESIGTSLLALMAALVIVKLALPLFQAISGIELALGAGELSWLVPMFFGLALFVGVVAGSYPAVYLSAFQPVKALKGGKGGSETGSGSARFRRFLVVGQFVLSTVMIIGTLVIGSQIRYMKGKDLGFQKDQILAIRTADRNILKILEQVKSRLKEVPGVLDVSATSFLPGQEQSGGGFVPEGFEGVVRCRNIWADPDFVRTLGMKIVQGRDLSVDMPSDEKNSVLINETAVRKVGWKDPIGKTMNMPVGPFRKLTKTVVGVVRDFHSSSLRDRIEPLMIQGEMTYLHFIACRIKADQAGRIVQGLKKAWGTISPGKFFDYIFLDESFDAQYRAEERLNKIFSSFSLMAIVIAGLGLFGLASYMAERRKKEVGIRKILGATVGEVVGLLSRDFIKLVGLAALVACPIAYFAMNLWLRGFAYRTRIQPWIFVGSGLAALAIAFLTVSYQAIRAASADPVDTLKHE